MHTQLAKLFGWDKSLTAMVSADEKVHSMDLHALGLPPTCSIAWSSLCATGVGLLCCSACEWPSLAVSIVYQSLHILVLFFNDKVSPFLGCKKQ